jgi:hypothetical protein
MFTDLLTRLLFASKSWWAFLEEGADSLLLVFGTEQTGEGQRLHRDGST